MKKIIRAAKNRALALRTTAGYVTSSLLHPSQREKLVYVSHHKCATQYTMAVLRAICRHKRLPAVKLDWRRKVSVSQFMLNKVLLIQDHSSDIIDIRSVQGRGFHVIRDPRDLLISMYFSHKESHVVRDPKAGEILRNREVLAELDLNAGLRYLIRNSEYFGRVMREMAAWDYQMRNFYETSFERLTTNPAAEFGLILEFLGLEVGVGELAEILERNSFGSLRSQWRSQHGEGANHYRKGRTGDWINHFSEATKELFKERHGKLLIRLGYAKDLDW
jgi:hypothetical protein